jgi:hypothetical protein
MTLDEAWKAAEAVLPQGWFVAGVQVDLWARSRGETAYAAIAGHDIGGIGDREAVGPTPTDALIALAALFLPASATESATPNRGETAG